MYAQLVLPRITGSTKLMDRRTPINKIHQRMDRFWDDHIATLDQAPGSIENASFDQYSPPLDFLESATAYFFEAELPGMTQAEVTIEIVANALIIQGEKRRRAADHAGRPIRSERKFGAFRLTAILPNDAVAETVHAKLDDGILTVSIEKWPASPALSKQVEIRAAA